MTGTLQKEAWLAGVLPPVEALRPWLWSVPVPMPDNPLRYVLVYVLVLDDGLVVLDTGWSSPAAWEALTAGLAAAGGSVRDVQGVLVTHAHHDHYGLAGRIREESGAWVAMHVEEARSLRTGRSPDEVRDSYVEHLVTSGMDPGLAEEVAGPSDRWRGAAEVSEPDRTFEDGETLVPALGLRAVWTPGHTPGHTCFLHPDSRLLFAGDHLLPRITPNISAYEDSSDGGPLSHYLSSLGALTTLEVDEVLPGHEYRFTGVGERVRQLEQHHEVRLAEVLNAVTERPGSTFDVAQRLTWSRPWAQMRRWQWSFAIGETSSHLQLLQHRGSVQRAGGRVPTWHVARTGEEEFTWPG